MCGEFRCVYGGAGLERGLPFAAPMISSPRRLLLGHSSAALLTVMLSCLALSACEAPPEELSVGQTEDALRVGIRVSASGSDVSGDGSEAAPFRTVRKALESVPLDAGDARYVIDCTDLGVEEVGPEGLVLPAIVSESSFVTVASPAHPALAVEGALTLQATPSTLLTLDAGSIVSQTPGAVHGMHTITASGVAWSPDQWKGKLLAGSGSGQIVVISGNTENALATTATGPLTPPIRIQTPSCELRNSSSSASTLVSRGSTATLMIAGLRISQANRLISALQLSSVGAARLTAVDVDGVAIQTGAQTPAFRASRLQGGAPIPVWANPHTQRRLARNNSSYGITGSLIQDLEFDTSSGAGSTASIVSTVIDGCSYLGQNPTDGYDGPWSLKGVAIKNAKTHGFSSAGGSPSTLIHTTIDGSAGDAIHADGVGSVYIPDVHGSGNAGWGVRAENGAQVELSMHTEVTGAAGDLRAGSRATRSFLDLRSNLPLGNEADFDAAAGDGSRIYQEEGCCGIWSHFSAGDSHEFGSPHSVKTDSAGDVVFVGRTASSSLSFPGGPAMPSLGGYDGFVVKLSSTGEHVWSRRLGGSANDWAHAVTVDASDAVFVVGDYSGQANLGGAPLPPAVGLDMFVVKLGPSGEHLWSRGLGTSGQDSANDVAVDANGDLYVIGARDWNPYGASGMISLHKLSGTTGEVLWQKSFATSGGAAGFGAATTPQGAVVIVGSFGNPGGGMIDFGGASLTSAWVRAGFVAQLDGSTGAHQWSRAIENSNQSDLNAVATTTSGGVFVAGASRGAARLAGGPAVATGGEYDLFVARLNGANGAHVWSKAFGGPGYEIGYDLAIGADDDVVVVGQLASSGVSLGGSVLAFAASPADVVVGRFDGATGAHLGSYSTGDSGDDVAFGVAVRPDTGNVHLVGHASGALDFGDGRKADPLAQYGYFVANLGRPGE